MRKGIIKRVCRLHLVLSHLPHFRLHPHNTQHMMHQNTHKKASHRRKTTLHYIHHKRRIAAFSAILTNIRAICAYRTYILSRF